jgi:hypothetical protein
MLYASGSNTLAKLSDVATGSALISGGVGVAPSYGKIGLTTHVTGTLAVGNGGTGIPGGYTTGDLLVASGTTTLTTLSAVATGNALLSGGAGVAPFYGKVGLTTHVTGTLPVLNGGTNTTSSTGTIAVVLSTSPTLVTPLLGTPTSGDLRNCTIAWGSNSFGANLIQFANVTLSSSNILNIATTPIVIATGSGTNLIKPISWSCIYTYSTTQYATGTFDIGFYYSTSTTISTPLLGTVITSANLKGTVNTYAFGSPSNIETTSFNPTTGYSIYAGITNGAPPANYTAGAGTINIQFYYIYVPYA